MVACKDVMANPAFQRTEYSPKARRGTLFRASVRRCTAGKAEAQIVSYSHPPLHLIKRHTPCQQLRRPDRRRLFLPRPQHCRDQPRGAAVAAARVGDPALVRASFGAVRAGLVMHHGSRLPAICDATHARMRPYRHSAARSFGTHSCLMWPPSHGRMGPHTVTVIDVSSSMLS